MNDIQHTVNLIEYAASKGAFKDASMYYNIGTLLDKYKCILAAQIAQQNSQKPE